MKDDPEFDPDTVDRFYDRQRREILARLEPAAGATAAGPRDGRGLRVAGLAAAAVVVLGAGLLLRPPPAVAPLELAAGDAAAAAGELPFDAYGSWPAAAELGTEAQGAASVEWLFDLAEHDGLSRTSLEVDSSGTEFLAAYGTWEEVADDVVAHDAT
jgi:hypothetical protein